MDQFVTMFKDVIIIITMDNVTNVSQDIILKLLLMELKKLQLVKEFV